MKSSGLWGVTPEGFPLPQPTYSYRRASIGLSLAAPLTNSRSSLAIVANRVPELRGDRKQEIFLSDPRAGTLRIVKWTPHRITLEADLKFRTGLIANMNYHSGWKIDHGTITNYKGLLGARLPTGRYRLTLYFSDFLVDIGLLISVLTLLAIGGFFGFQLYRVRFPLPEPAREQPPVSDQA